MFREIAVARWNRAFAGKKITPDDNRLPHAVQPNITSPQLLCLSPFRKSTQRDSLYMMCCVRMYYVYADPFFPDATGGSSGEAADPAAAASAGFVDAGSPPPVAYGMQEPAAFDLGGGGGGGDQFGVVGDDEQFGGGGGGGGGLGGGGGDHFDGMPLQVGARGQGLRSARCYCVSVAVGTTVRRCMHGSERDMKNDVAPRLWWYATIRPDGWRQRPWRPSGRRPRKEEDRHVEREIWRQKGSTKTKVTLLTVGRAGSPSAMYYARPRADSSMEEGGSGLGRK